MAFNIDYMARVNTSANEKALRVWVYNGTSTGSNEALATIIASAYFNAFQQNLTSGSEAGPLVVNDVILVHGTDGRGFYRVSSITTNVALADLQAGSIATADIEDLAVTTAKLAAGAVTNAKVDASAAIAFSKLAALTDARFLVGNGSNVATDVAMSGDATLANTGAVTLGAVVNAAKVADYADEDVIAGSPVLHIFNMAAGATATRSIATAQKIKVIDAWAVNKGAGSAADTVQVKNNAGTAITDALDMNVGDKLLVRAGEIDDAASTVNAGDNLSVTITDGGGSDVPAIDVYVLCVKIA